MKQSLNEYKALFEAVCDSHKAQYGLMSEEAYESLKGKYLANSDLLRQKYSIEPDRFIAEADSLYKLLHEDKVGKQILDNYFRAFRIVSQFVTEPRAEGRVIYPVHTVIMIMMMAKFLDCTTAEEIERFYNTRSIILQLLIPGMPPPEHLITASTINNIRSRVSAKDTERLFNKLFGAIDVTMGLLITYDHDKYGNLQSPFDLVVLALDGQEVRSSFRKGEAGERSKKGAIVVTLFNCGQRRAEKFTNTDLKNHERKAFLDMTEDMDLTGKLVMCDALNVSGKVTSRVVDHGGYYLMPIKCCTGNKELCKHVEAIFNREHKHTLKRSDVFGDHSRTEQVTIEVLPADLYLDPRIKNPHKEVNTLVKYTKKTSSSKNAEEHFYICSLPFKGEDTLTEVRTGILQYWFIEVHHNILDTSRLQQDRFQACIPETLSLEVALNKIAYNVLTAERNRMTKTAGRKKPISYASTMKRMADWPLFTLYQTVFIDYMLNNYQNLSD